MWWWYAATAARVGRLRERGGGERGSGGRLWRRRLPCVGRLDRVRQFMRDRGDAGPEPKMRSAPYSAGMVLFILCGAEWMRDALKPHFQRSDALNGGEVVAIHSDAVLTSVSLPTRIKFRAPCWAIST